MFSLVFTRRYSMGHRLRRSAPKCAVPHGHNSVVKVTLHGDKARPIDGAHNDVAPFGLAKARWHEWIDEHVDHALHLDESDPLLTFFRETEPEQCSRILVVPGDPTTEMMTACFAAKVNAILADAGLGLTCGRVEVEETPTNTVVFEGDPASVLPGGRERWWWRADMTINDLPEARARAGHAE